MKIKMLKWWVVRFTITDFKITYTCSSMLVMDCRPTTWTYLWEKYWHVMETIYIMGWSLSGCSMNYPGGIYHLFDNSNNMCINSSNWWYYVSSGSITHPTYKGQGHIIMVACENNIFTILNIMGWSLSGCTINSPGCTCQLFNNSSTICINSIN